jgi:vacuolar protein sorting-associated protein IST1
VQIIEKLSVKAPSAESKLKVLKAIAHEYNLDWDSSNTEAEFNKKYEDLLVIFANLLLISLLDQNANGYVVS